ncbi:three-Cys-motif partner protein TcmP [Effusibacillus pohliae]|uniref:three-Cys-motif partner protein TcmP n=1 Tax=Effusibacillus pohliae TaxID=232270 RepID=UPI00039EBCCB|nr:three-Cys-motif partner protein TcmP [Effusibacillus pohliae]
MGYGSKENTIGQWSIDKLAFLERYLPAYLKATKTALHRYYIDGFAGRGEWIHRETKEKVAGSATIAFKYAEQFTKLHFCELEEDRVQDLKKLAKQHNVTDKVQFHQGDCNIVLPSIMRSIHPTAPTFVFLDPSGDHIHWSTIETLALWRTELFILYPYHMTLLRYLPRDPRRQEGFQKERLNKFFGTDEWEEIYRCKPRTYLLFGLLDLYTRRLQEVGYPYCYVSKCFKSTTGQKLYYMIWVGKHKAGKNIMDWVYKQQSNQISLDI